MRAEKARMERSSFARSDVIKSFLLVQRLVFAIPTGYEPSSGRISDVFPDWSNVPKNSVAHFNSGHCHFLQKYKGTLAIGERLLTYVRGGNARYSDNYSQNRIEGDANAGNLCPKQSLAVMFGMLALGGFIICAKGVYRQSYVMVIGGWLVAAIFTAIGTVWVIFGHFPLFSEHVSAGAGIDALARRMG
jgi:hypothetical protein